MSVPTAGIQQDRDLVLRVRSGDRGAFAELVRKYAGVVRALVRGRLRREHDVEDACQEVFLLAYRRLDALGDPERFAGWLTQIARNKATELIRRSARRPAGSLDAIGVDPPGEPEADRLETNEEVERMLAAVQELDETTRDVLALRFRDGLAVKEIAARLGQRPPAISMRITRALRRVRARLEAGDA